MSHVRKLRIAILLLGVIAIGIAVLLMRSSAAKNDGILRPYGFLAGALIVGPAIVAAILILSSPARRIASHLRQLGISLYDRRNAAS